MSAPLIACMYTARSSLLSSVSSHCPYRGTPLPQAPAAVKTRGESRGEEEREEGGEGGGGRREERGGGGEEGKRGGKREGGGRDL